MAQTIKMFRNDTSPNQVFTITRQDGTVVNLTSCTVRLRIADPITGALTNNNTNNICTITDASNGVCSYAWNETDLPDPGAYTANLQITFPTLDPESGRQVETYGLIIQVTDIVS